MIGLNLRGSDSQSLEFKAESSKRKFNFLSFSVFDFKFSFLLLLNRQREGTSAQKKRAPYNDWFWCSISWLTFDLTFLNFFKILKNYPLSCSLKAREDASLGFHFRLRSSIAEPRRQLNRFLMRPDCKLARGFGPENFRVRELARTEFQKVKKFTRREIFTVLAIYFARNVTADFLCVFSNFSISILRICRRT